MLFLYQINKLKLDPTCSPEVCVIWMSSWLFDVAAGAEGASVGSSWGVRASAGRSHRGQGQQGSALRFQPPTPVHHHREKGQSRSDINWLILLFYFITKVHLFFHPSISHLCVHWKNVSDSVLLLHLLLYFIHQVRDLISFSFILSVLFDHIFICSTKTNTSIYITTQKSVIDLFSHSVPLLQPSLFPSSSVFLSFVLSSFGCHHSCLRCNWCIDLEMN